MRKDEEDENYGTRGGLGKLQQDVHQVQRDTSTQDRETLYAGLGIRSAAIEPWVSASNPHEEGLQAVN